VPRASADAQLVSAGHQEVAVIEGYFGTEITLVSFSSALGWLGSRPRGHGLGAGFALFCVGFAAFTHDFLPRWWKPIALTSFGRPPASSS